jgi:hypothetical protein
MKIKELKNLKKIKLSDLEKKNLFTRISNSIQKEDAKIKFNYPVPSPFFRFSFIFESRYVKVGVMAVFILFLSSATTFASLDTLPGDLLYGIKTSVVEKIPSLFYISPESRAKDNSKKIEKRIDEFEKLAEKGRLTEENTKKIEKNINKNLGDFDQNIREIKERAIGKEDKNYLEKDLESRLEKRTEKIKKIREDEKVSDKRALQSVLERVDSGREEDILLEVLDAAEEMGL